MNYFDIARINMEAQARMHGIDIPVHFPEEEVAQVATKLRQVHSMFLGGQDEADQLKQEERQQRAESSDNLREMTRPL